MNKQIEEKLKNKAKIENTPETVKPTVINDRLIHEYLTNYNRENKLFGAQADIYIWELTKLSLSFKNIIAIDNLQELDKLEFLQLDNNIICEIANLEHLTNLKWLDLSFNLIKKIQGLDTLTKLTDLSLYSNEITELSGLENLCELNVLSVGKNKIKSFDTAIKYLKPLKNRLEVLKIRDNAFCEEKEYQDDVKTYRLMPIALLKNLKYLDYELIESSERTHAEEAYKDEVNDKGNDANEAAEEVVHHVDQELIDAHIKCTDELFSNLCQDEETVKLKDFEKFKEIFAGHESMIEDNLQKMQGDIKKKTKEKVRIIRHSEEQMRNAEIEADRECIKLIEKFRSQMKHMSRYIEKEKDKELDNMMKILNEQNQKILGQLSLLKDDLLDNEIKMQQALKEAMKKFQTDIKERNDDIVTLITTFFADFVVGITAQFQDEMKKTFLSEQEKFEQFCEDEDWMNENYKDKEDLLQLLFDKENLISVLDASRDNMDNEINKMDSEVQSAINEEWKSKQSDIQEKQHSRNRDVVAEIIDICEKFEDEIQKKFKNWKNDLDLE